jgi:hypothetical protein
MARQIITDHAKSSSLNGNTLFKYMFAVAAAVNSVTIWLLQRNAYQSIIAPSGITMYNKACWQPYDRLDRTGTSVLVGGPSAGHSHYVSDSDWQPMTAAAGDLPAHSIHGCG